MAVRPNVSGAGQSGPRPLARPASSKRAAERPSVDGVIPGPADEEAPAAASLDLGATAVTPSEAPQPTGALPRWLVLLIGAATATVAIAGVREIAWLVGPVLLALVVVVALTPVERWLLGIGVP